MEKQQAYVHALLAEWKDRQSELEEEVKTIYIGGGTPSTLSLANLQDILHSIHVQSNHQEVTLEVNPGDITPEKAYAWRQMGINRLSIGVQTFDDGLLKLIGRRHSALQAREAITIAQAAGFDNISIDLIYALPGQTMQQWKQDIDTVLQLRIQHISTYGLIYENGTRLSNMLESGAIVATDEELEMQMYDYLVETLNADGFTHYEVSNFARKNYKSKHNSSYWNNTPYIGLGAGAHSYDGKKRSWNISNLDTYIHQALAHQLQPEVEILSKEEQYTERIMLGMRTREGVPKHIVNQQAAENYIQQGLLIENNEHYIATTKGFHLLNRIIEDLLQGSD